MNVFSSVIRKYPFFIRAIRTNGLCNKLLANARYFVYPKGSMKSGGTEEKRKKLIALVEAVYRVTAVLPSNEVLRMRMRSEALSLLSSFEHTSREGRYDHCVASVSTLLGFLEIARSQQWVSGKNLHILKKAFLDFRDSLKASEERSAESLVERRSHAPPTPSVGSSPPAKSAGDDNNNRTENHSARKYTPQTSSQKTENILSPRQKKILEYFERHHKARVSDLAHMLPDISRRTIRRDLDRLARTRFIEKDGKTNGMSYVRVVTLESDIGASIIST